MRIWIVLAVAGVSLVEVGIVRELELGLATPLVTASVRAPGMVLALALDPELASIVVEDYLAASAWDYTEQTVFQVWLTRLAQSVLWVQKVENFRLVLVQVQGVEIKTDGKEIAVETDYSPWRDFP